MKDFLGMNHDDMADTFLEWNKGELDSFLIEITAHILKHRDDDGDHLVSML
jgi:6-phosphogluconate dehydrogenase